MVTENFLLTNTLFLGGICCAVQLEPLSPGFLKYKLSRLRRCQSHVKGSIFILVNFYQVSFTLLHCRYIKAFLEMEPANRQARELHEVIVKRSRVDSLTGAAIVTSIAAFVLGVGIALLKH